MKGFFKSSKKIQAEKTRMAREEANLRQRLLQLPAELRNQIYEELIPSGVEIKRNSKGSTAIFLPPPSVQLPALLHTCRRLREEIFPIFYGQNVVTIVLQHLNLHSRSKLRIQSCANLLPASGTDSWRQVKLESCARCFHSDGFAMLANVDVFIDRSCGTVLPRARGGRSLQTCCQDAQSAYCDRLAKAVKSMRLHEGERKLRTQDFERLARRMDEQRSDWPMSPRRVVPPRDQLFRG